MSLSLTLSFDGHRVRMVGSPERPEWCARDVCHLLLIHNTGDALAKSIPEAERGVAIFYTPGGPQQMATVTEPGLYRLILRSRKPAAERFRTWMVRDVIPCIRRHGCYPAPAATGEPGNALAVFEAAVAALREQAERTARLEARVDVVETVLQPKAEACDRLSLAGGDLSIRHAAKSLQIPEKQLIGRLIADKIAFRNAQGKVEPYADQVKAGRFRLRTVVIGEEEPGVDRVTTQAMVRPEGLVWLAARYPLDSISSAVRP